MRFLPAEFAQRGALGEWLRVQKASANDIPNGRVQKTRYIKSTRLSRASLPIDTNQL